MIAIRSKVVLALLCCYCLWLMGPSQVDAGPVGSVVPPTFSVRIEDGPDARTWRYTPTEGVLKPSDEVKDAFELTERLEFDILSNRTHFTIDELMFDPDPFVLNNILITNTMPTTETFVVSVGLPTAFGALNLISSEIQTSIIDGGFDGATIETIAPNSIYTAQIDGFPVATLQNHPFSLIASGGSSNSASASFGPSTNALAVTTDLAIELRFRLTPGDTAAILSRFDVVEVPEPTVIGLSIAAFLTPIGRRRGRNRKETLSQSASREYGHKRLQ